MDMANILDITCKGYMMIYERMGACPRGFAGAGNIMGCFGEEEVRSECEGEFWGHR